ncbi:Biotin sulfoxide reductase [Klebsiella pneumoniae IS43]|uniref:Biotin sulfoxide reductase n=1 Tax=Klebsiella pneumoniae IS43 TaxID=1432552 RepID=W1DEJ8_KLEPN|nr:Biotin sulfoxide reductase [Klebsiella pneumoniae IS43]
MRDQVHSKTRVRYPMVRKGFLASPDKPQGVRGQDEFVRVSWEQALDLIDAQHRRIRDSYGPASILPAPTAGALTAYCIRRRRCCSAI